ncbi:MAG: hypothetical protein K2R98_33165 [Gemmataceae bacterium]|nr:hypothetical protein [Gemmataceae bacterium]
MNTPIRAALCALALIVPGAVCLHAAEPPRTGHVLVLENARILEGDIERVGAQYRVRRTIGETWIPGDKVQALCASMEEAYAFLRGQANLRDPDEHLRLARWCQLHGLRSQAVAEAAAAVELRPNHEESKRFLTGLQRTETVTPAPARPHSENADTGPLPVPDFNADSLGMFVSRVQPILMNACASCHAGDRSGSFKLTRTYEGQLTNRKATQQNLAAVLSQVNQERPQSSRLLVRAVTAHGGAGDQAPLKSRQAPAYRLMEDWVQFALRNVPARENVIATSPVAVAEPKTASEPAPSKPVAAPTPVPQSVPFATMTAPAAAPSVPTTPAPATPAEGPSDPFDPAIFNQQHSGNAPANGDKK